MPANALAITIFDCKCACGHQWTHSTLMLYGNGMLGGTPNEAEEAALPLKKAFLRPPRTYSHCPRCLSATIPCEMTRSAPAAKQRSSPPSLTLAQLEGDIF